MSGTVTIIDYGSGNLRSAEKALQRAVRDAGLSQTVIVTSDADAVAKAERIVLPGVGAFADCMSGLSRVPGMVDVLQDAVIAKGRPFLGICVGMQLMASRGLEHGEHKGLGWIPGDVMKLAPRDPALKVPHMGWNTLRVRRAHPVVGDLPADTHAYFVHSFHIKPTSAQHVIADTEYGETVAAIVGRDNLIGTQFHPEKSQAVGLGLLANFLRWRP